MRDLDYVKEVIAGRDVAVVAPGPSLTTLQEHIKEFADRDWCWVGIPKFWIIDQTVLSIIDKHIQVVWTGCTLTIKSDRQEIYEFVHRDFPTVFVTKGFGLNTLKDVCYDSWNRLVCYEPTHCNALSALLVMLRKLECDNVYIFGADGKVVNEKLHFGQEVLEKKYDWYHEANENRMTAEMIELDVGFDYFCLKSGAGYPTRFINVTEDSVLTLFEEMPYEQFMDHIRLL